MPSRIASRLPMGDGVLQFRSVPGGSAAADALHGRIQITTAGSLSQTLMSRREQPSRRSHYSARLLTTLPGVSDVTKKAILAVPASMLTTAYHMPKNGVKDHDLGAEHFTHNDRSKAIQRQTQLHRRATQELTRRLGRALLKLEWSKGILSVVRKR